MDNSEQKYNASFIAEMMEIQRSIPGVQIKGDTKDERIGHMRELFQQVKEGRLPSAAPDDQDCK